MIERIELVVRLVRSKGVGVFFVTQNPLDIPDTVLAQLGNRVQHALRAFTPRDQKAVKAAADTMRANPGLDVAAAITELGVGEALVSLLDEKGRPSLTERVFIIPPSSQIGPITAAQRKELIDNSIVAGVYEKTVDRASAFESLKGGSPGRAPASATAPAPAANTQSAPAPSVRGVPATPAEAPAAPERGILDGIGDLLGGGTHRTRTSAGEQLIKSAASAVGREVGRQIIRGVLGGLFGSSRR